MADLFDIVIARKLSGGGGGGTTVEALSVTQNGTYTAPSGKAYSPVTVNVSGGSSDFSTAQVTIDDQLSPPSDVYVQTWIDSNDDKLLAGYDYDGGNYFDFATNTPFELVLYKSQAVINIATDSDRTVLVTVNPNNAVIDNLGDGLYDVTITGDCTITIS